MIIAGEASGDMRAAGLARSLKKLDPTLKLTGIGGPYMRDAGVECFTDITQLAVIGIVEVLKNLGRIKRVFDQTLEKMDANPPNTVVLVDYPGFNLRLAAEIKKRHIKTVYYISPQVWAWREKRVLKIKKIVDRMIVLFPFEGAIYQKYGMNVDYVGHPLVDEIIVNKSASQVLQNLKLGIGKTTVGLMPGSRLKEVERHLLPMLEAAKILYEQNKNFQFILLKAPSIPLNLLESFLTRQDLLPIKIYEGDVYDGINAMDAAMVASGTATLECALLQKPMVIIYKTSWVTYAIAKSVIKLP
ncbi:MAG: lipid-A-disaccharide synthase, partial [Candidatus Omnitrophica bacterium]|nr:lipid-A-disaccharide synthase [Candidatus Omnitrophota bacterium]